MRAFDPEIFNNNAVYRIPERIREACKQVHIKSYFHNHWVMVPSKEDARLLAEEIMKSFREEYGENFTIRLTADILWEMCALEMETKND